MRIEIDTFSFPQEPAAFFFAFFFLIVLLSFLTNKNVTPDRGIVTKSATAEPHRTQLGGEILTPLWTCLSPRPWRPQGLQAPGGSGHTLSPVTAARTLRASKACAVKGVVLGSPAGSVCGGGRGDGERTQGRGGEGDWSCTSWGGSG